MNSAMVFSQSLHCDSSTQRSMPPNAKIYSLIIESLHSSFLLRLLRRFLLFRSFSCQVVICVLKSKSRRPQISSRIRKHRGRVRDELMTNTSRKRPSTNHSQDAASSSTKKRAKKVVEDDAYMGDIAKSLRKIAEAFEMSTVEFIKQNKQANAEYIWVQLEDIGVEPAFLPHVYIHLVQHPVALKAFNGIPVHKRKEFLSHIVPGYSPSH